MTEEEFNGLVKAWDHFLKENNKDEKEIRKEFYNGWAAALKWSNYAKMREALEDIRFINQQKQSSSIELIAKTALKKMTI